MKSVYPPHVVDVHVGQRMRALRKERGLSQEALAVKLGITFQQIQKYERGENRVSASKLYEAAVALEVSIATFFEGLGARPARPSLATQHALQLLGEPHGAALIDAGLNISSQARSHFVELLRHTAGCS